MKIVLLYLRILKKFDPTFPEHKSYSESSKRFLETYRKFKPSIPHELVVVNCGKEKYDSMFDDVASDYRTFSGGGFDCGTYQAIAPTIDCDLLFALNTHTYFWRESWLDLFVLAANRFGPGVYGATASYERTPHLRTPSIAFSPKIMAAYPFKVDTRQGAADFEAGPDNFSMWAKREGYPVLLIAGSGCYKQEDWRKPANIFRDGNQTNCLIWDRHTDVYTAADETEKLKLSNDADGIGS